MNYYPQSLIRLIEELAGIPGIGNKSATKIAYSMLEMPQQHVLDIARAIVDMKKKIHFCSRCHHLTEEELCSICQDDRRNPHLLCVVDTPRDLIAIEKTREFKGYYHVLHGRLSPLDGIRPQDLTIDSLQKRLQTEPIEEIILANAPTMEGESTAVYLSKLLKDGKRKITRIAHGVPIGGDLEFADEITLLKAIEGRQDY